MIKIPDWVKRRWKRLTILLVIILLLSLGVRAGLAKKPNKNITTAQVNKQDLAELVSASGKVKTDQQVTLKFQTSGYLNWIGVKKGDYVETGQAIASLDQRLLEKSLKQELLDYENERFDMDEERKDNNVTSNKFDDFYMTDAVKYDLKRSQNTLDRTVLDVEIASIALKYATLTTPISGMITEIGTPYAGINITPATAEITITNPTQLVFSANIDEVDIGRIRAGQTGKIVLDAYSEEVLELPVADIEFTPTLTSGGGTAYAVKFVLPETDNQKFRLGMNGDVDISVQKKNQALTVPVESIREEGEAVFVWLDENKEYRKTEVKTGIATDGEIEITDGLNEGDSIVTAGFNFVEKQ
jgi:HlyD family secretion protein